jgi:hypothetical protein
LSAAGNKVVAADKKVRAPQKGEPAAGRHRKHACQALLSHCILLANMVICRSRLNAKINRNFEVFSPTDFLAAITQHISDKGAQTVRYYGLFSAPRSRGGTRLP